MDFEFCINYDPSKRSSYTLISLIFEDIENSEEEYGQFMPKINNWIEEEKYKNEERKTMGELQKENRNIKELIKEQKSLIEIQVEALFENAKFIQRTRFLKNIKLF